MFEKWIGQKPRKIFTVRFGPASQSIGRGQISPEGALDVRAKVENGVTKSCQSFRRKNRRNAIFWPDFFQFFEQDRLLFARAWQSFRQKQPKKKEMGFDFFPPKVGVRIPFSMGNREFSFFCCGKTNFCGGTTSKLASQWSSWGIYKHGANDVCYIEKQVAK